jgi:hypothetical protein
MRYIILLAFPALWCACQNAATTPTPTAAPLEIKSETIQRKSCRNDSSCTEFNVRYPVAYNTTPALRDSIKNWVDRCVNGCVLMNPSPQIVPISQCADSLIAMWQGDDSVMASIGYSYDLTDTLLVLTEKYITLRLDWMIYVGGAHPNNGALLGTFDRTTGRQLGRADFVGDTTVLLQLLDNQYKTLKELEPDYTYMTDSGKIAVPAQIGMVREGLWFHYDPYEVSAYAVGPADIFLTWAQMGTGAKFPYKN